MQNEQAEFSAGTSDPIPADPRPARTAAPVAAAPRPGPQRSLSQQALADLEAIAGGDSRQRRRQVLDRIAERGPLSPSLAAALSGNQAPEALIRADRERCR